MKKIVLVFLMFCAIFFLSFKSSNADSWHTTSGEIFLAYMDVSIVKKSLDSYSLTDELSEFISNKENSIDVKLAAINALTWYSKSISNISGKYLSFLSKKYGFEHELFADEKKFLQIMNLFTGDEALCLGYMMLFDVPKFLFGKNIVAELLEYSIQKNETSFSYRIIDDMVIESFGTRNYGSSYCSDGFYFGENVFYDMRPEAQRIVLSYKKNMCKENTPFYEAFLKKYHNIALLDSLKYLQKQ